MTPSEGDSLDALREACARQAKRAQVDGDFERAEDLLLVALHAEEHVAGESSRGVADLLWDLADNARMWQRPDDEGRYLERAVEIGRVESSARPWVLAERLRVLSLNRLAKGRYLQAKAASEEALRLFVSSKGAVQGQANTLLGLGTIQAEMGDCRGAIATWEEALGVVLHNQRLITGPRVLQAHALNNLGTCRSDLGDFDAAQRDYEAALAIYAAEKAAGDALEGESLETLQNLGINCMDLRDYDCAVKNLEAALAELGAERFSDSSVREKTRHRGEVLGTLGEVRSLQGQHDLARQLLQEAVLALEFSAGPAHPKTAAVLHQYAYARYRANDLRGAIVFGARAVRIVQALRRDQLVSGQGGRGVPLEKWKGTFHHLAAWMQEAGRPDDAQIVLQMVQDLDLDVPFEEGVSPRAKGGLPELEDEERELDRLYGSLSGKVIAAGEQFRELDARLRRGDADPALRERIASLDADLGKWRRQFARFTKSFERKYPLLQTLQVSASGRMGRRLGEGEVLIQYASTPEVLYVFMTTANASVARKSSIGDSGASALRQGVENALREWRGPEDGMHVASQALYDLLIGPVEDELRQLGAKTMYVQADGVLRHVPFAALHDGKGYLVARYAVVRFMGVGAVPSMHRAAGGVMVEAFAATRAASGVGGALDGASQEVDRIVRTQDPADTLGALHGIAHIDREFTADALRHALRSTPIVHVASHFRLDPSSSEGSAVLLGDGSQLSLDELAGFQPRSDLVVLTACDTAYGSWDVSGPASIDGLGELLIMSGVREVIATAWSVSDEASPMLMETLYQGLARGLSPAVALQQAQTSVLTSRYRSPRYWAPFVLMSDSLGRDSALAAESPIASGAAQPQRETQTQENPPDIATHAEPAGIHPPVPPLATGGAVGSLLVDRTVALAERHDDDCRNSERIDTWTVVADGALPLRLDLSSERALKVSIRDSTGASVQTRRVKAGSKRSWMYLNPLDAKSTITVIHPASCPRTGYTLEMSSVPVPTPADRPATYVLIVPVAESQLGPIPLPGVTVDKHAMRDLFVQHLRLPEYQVKVLDDPQDQSRFGLARAILEHLSRAGPRGTAVFYFSGHGGKVNNRALTGLQDPEAGDGKDEVLLLYDSILLDDELAVLLSRTNAGRILEISDACFSGDMERAGALVAKTFNVAEVLAEGLGGPAAVPGLRDIDVFIAAASANAPAYTGIDKLSASPSLLTFALASEIPHQLRRKPSLTFSQLMTTVSERVERAAQTTGRVQKPMIGGRFDDHVREYLQPNSN